MATSTSRSLRATTAIPPRCSTRRSWSRPSTSSPRSSGAAVPSSSGSGPADRAPARAARRAGARDRPVGGDGRATAREARGRRRRRDDRDSRRPGGRTVLSRLPGLQHDREPDHQDAQVACFRNVAEHLQPGGSFVIEVGVPELQRLPPGETVRAFRVSETRWGSTSTTSPRKSSPHITSGWMTAGSRRFSLPFRYVWPSELDLMAQLAGMTAARALGRLEGGAVHEREREARLGLGEGSGLGC